MSTAKRQLNKWFMTAEQKIRKDFLCDAILKEMNVSVDQITLWSRDEDIAFAKCLITLIMDEENYKSKAIQDILKISRKAVHDKLQMAKGLLSVHPVFKSKYLKIIQIITENED